MALDGNPEEASMSYIIRDHDREKFEARKAQITHIQEELNQRFDQERIKVDMYDQYYNMKEIIEKDMSIVELAKQAMIELGISPVIEPVRGGTDGSKSLTWVFRRQIYLPEEKICTDDSNLFLYK